MKCKMIFMLLCGMLLSTLSVVAQQVTNKIYIPEVQCGRGKTISVPVAVTNDNEIVALQFKLQLPSGATLVNSSWTLTDRKTDHTLTMSRVSGNQYLVVVYSPTNAALRGNSGNLINFSLNIPETWEVGSEYPFVIEEPILSARNGDNLLTAFENGNLTVIDDPRPDVAVSAVKTDKSSYAPGDKMIISWVVKNEGDKETGDGWSEQVTLVADNGESCYLGTVYYNPILGTGGTANRQAELVLPDLLGVEGEIYARVKLIPGKALGELSTASGNNVAQSESKLSVAKHLKLELPAYPIGESNTSMIRCKLYRSGSWGSEQTFTLKTDMPERLNVPESVTIPVGQSGGNFYIHAINNDVLDTDSIIKISVEGNGYPSLAGNVIIEDDDYPTLLMKTSKTELTEGESFLLSVEREAVKDVPLTINLSCNRQARFKYPAQVVIPAGEKSVSIEVKSIDDNIPDATAGIDFTVSAPKYISGKCILILNDNDVPQIQLVLSSEEVNESSGGSAVIGRVVRTTNLDSKITVKLTLSSADAYLSYETLVFPAGASAQEFSIGIVDNALKEGDREVTVTASVYLPSCNCSAAVTSGGHVIKSFKILDDDGPSLSLTTSQPTILEGATEGILLKVTRNNTENIDMAVTLTSDNTADLVFDKNIVIPAGKSSADVKVYAKANELSEGDRTCTITASSDGYTKGICWVMITDQTLPDAVISSLTLSRKELLAGDTLTVSAKITNKGAAPLPAKTKVMVYLTPDRKYNSHSKKTLLTTLYTQRVLGIGQEELVSRNFTLPDVTGDYYIVGIANEDQSVKELISVNNVTDLLPLILKAKYSATASVEKTLYNQGEEITISGKVSGVNISNAKVEVYIICNGARQVLETLTDSQGNYKVIFKPSSGQMGHFIVGACYPNQGIKTEMAAFDIYGIRRMSDAWITWNVSVDEAYSGKIELINPCNVPLTNVKAELGAMMNGCQVDFINIPSIPANGKGEISYTVTGRELTNLSDYERLPLIISTDEGASLSTTVFYHCKSQKPALRASLSSINTTVTKGIARDYSIVITNEGKGETGAVSVVLPTDQKWITAVTPLQMPSMLSGDSAVVILRFTTTEDMQLNVPVTGTFGINCKNGNGIPLSFSIEPVSETKGILVVDVKDEYTYFTAEAPHVAGAKVVIRHPVSRQVLYEGVTDSNGLFTVTNIPEGYYAINVTADKHDSYANNLLVDPGKTTKVDVDLTFQAITYDWNVVETEVEDEYEIETVVKYETNVPVPVVVTTYPNEIYCKNYIFNLTLTNKGLITAQNVTIKVPEIERMKFELLCENPIAQLRAQESVTVPVRVIAEVEYDDVVFTHSRIANKSSGSNTDDPSKIVSYRTKFKSAKAKAGWGSKCMHFSLEKYWEYYCAGKYKTASDYYDYFYGPDGLCNNSGSSPGGSGGSGGGGYPSLGGGSGGSYGASSGGSKVSIEVCSKKDDNESGEGDDIDPEEQPCDKEPELYFKIVSVDDDNWEVNGLAADGVSKVKIILDKSKSKIPSPECNYEVSWNLENDWGALESKNGIWGAIYKAPAEFPLIIPASSTAKVRILIKVSGEFEPYEKVVEVEIVKVPVVMVHGLNANKKSWGDLEKGLKNCYYNDWQLYRVDYSESNKMSFSYNRDVVRRNIQQTLNKCLREHHFVVSKVDVVGHSMGGLLTKLCIKNGDGNFVRKLITLNTPHGGSQLGNFLNDPRIMFVRDVRDKILEIPYSNLSINLTPHPNLRKLLRLIYWQFGSNDSGRIDDGAVFDLSVGGSAIQEINNSSINGVKCHAVVSCVNNQNWVGNDLSETVEGAGFAYLADLFGYRDAPNMLEDLYNGDKHDRIVPLESQKGGLEIPKISYFEGSYGHMNHTSSTKEPAILQKIINLLSLPENDTAFSNGFNSTGLLEYSMNLPVDVYETYTAENSILPGTRVLGEKPTPLSLYDGQAISIDVNYNVGDSTLRYIVSHKDEITDINVIGIMNNKIVFVSSSERDTILLPKRTQGDLVIFYEGKTAEGYYYTGSTSQQINTLVNSYPAKLFFEKDTVRIAVEEFASPTVYCVWSDNDTTEVQPIYSVEDGTYAYVGEGGTVYGRKAGRTTLSAYYGDIDCIVPLFVLGEYGDDDEKPSKGVCSTISLSFKQNVTIARQAFRGTLTVFNGHEALAIDSLQLNLEIRDNDGNLATIQQFAISYESIDKFSGELAGPWKLGAKQTGTATVLFVPSKYAAPTAPKEYSFGGTITYKDPFTGLFVTRELYPVKLTVKPCPDLLLSYFVERDVLGDDPDTKEIEPSVPAEFSLLINNVGYGDANTVKIATGQPEIVDNQKGLAIHFEIIGSNLNGQATTMNFANLDFGSIAAGKQAYAQWYFKSSLLGHFVEYNTTLTKGSSYGNEDFNLLSIEGCHELIRSLKLPGTTLSAFMVNDIKDANDLPDCVYLTDGTVDTKVTIVSDQVSYHATGDNQYTLTLPAASGWVYGMLQDPTNGKKRLSSVIRSSDGAVIDLQNFWQTDRTLRDGKDPLRENRLRFADRLSGMQESYTLTFIPKPDQALEVESFGGVPTGDVHAAITEIQVNFNKPIDASTFTADDITLYCQSTKADLSGLVIIPLSDTQFNLDLSALAPRDGYHVLTIQTAEIEDKEGFPGETGKSASWNQFVGGKVKLNVTIYPDKAGKVTPENKEFAFGTRLELKAEPNDGYLFSCWKINGEKVSEEPVYNYQIVSDRNVKAEFKAVLYDVTIEYDLRGGEVSLGKGIGKYEYNTLLQLTALPNAGYSFDGWKVDGKIVSTDVAFAVTILKNVTVEAVFTKLTDAVTVSYELPQGWNWLSFNVRDDKLNTPKAMLDPVKQSVISVLGQTDDLVYDEQYGFYGSLQLFLPDRAYKMRLKEEANFELKGVPYASNETTVTLNKGWNWIGYVPTVGMTLAEALANLRAEENDIIKAQDNFAVYDGSEWTGSLTMLVPQSGYMYYSGSVKSFNYVQGTAPLLYRASRVSDDKLKVWPYDERRYADNMAVISRLNDHNGQEASSERFVVGAFVGNECRGMSVHVDGYLFITIHGENPGEKIDFRAFDTVTGEEYAVRENIGFGNGMVGSLNTPLALHLRYVITGIEKNSTGVVVYPNPVKDRLFIRMDIKEVSEVLIVDMNGSILQRVERIPTEEGIDVTALSEGIYFVVLRTETGVIHQKFMKLNNIK